MNSKSLLDYALFQLTPTRTRCDLVIFCGGKSEKLASGLVEPFLSHLKYAKDEIPKGGYSIKLSPPKSDPFWFTKSTFQRFVRFVSTPEVLERFARLEKEILQIENSVQSNEFTQNNVTQVEEGNLSNVIGISKQSPNSSKIKGDTNGSDEALQEENSKIALQRILETRKSLLRKEQAMAYARALAAGFELENLDDLIHFADNFGASRLRDACKEFKDLCMKKHTDDLWMDELAAMKAMPQPELPFLGSSGIVLSFENNNGKLVSQPSLDASSDSITSQENVEGNKDNHAASSDNTPPKGQMTWQNQIPPYMYNFQNGNQYQPYPFQMQPGLPPYYPQNMNWPQNSDEPDHRRTRRSSSSYKKKERTQNLEQEEEKSEASDSDTESETEVIEKSHKKRGKKSAKTIVIRNINYVTSKKRNEENDSSSGDDVAVDEDTLNQVLGTLDKHNKSKSSYKKKGSADQEFENELNDDSSKGNENWDAFQNLLLSEKESNENTKNGDIYGNGDSIQFDSEKIQARKNFQTVVTDSFIVSERNEINQGGNNLKDLENSEISRLSMKKSNFEDDSLLFPRRSEENKNNSNITKKLSDIGSESMVIKSGNGEDWFVVNNSQKSENQISSFEQTIIRGNYAFSSNGTQIESKKNVPIDDSFMVQSHDPINDDYDSHWKTDMSMVSGVISNDQSKSNTCQEPVGQVAHEPDDLCVILARDSGSVSIGASWSPEVDYNVEASFVEPEKKPASVEINEKVEEKKLVNGKKSPANGVVKQTRPKGVQGALSKSRLEALSKSKKPTPISKSMPQKSKLEKEEEARKKAEELVIERQKRIAERSAAKKAPLGTKVASPKTTSPKTSITRRTST